MVRSRDILSTFLSLTRRAALPVVGVGLLVVLSSRGEDDLTKDDQVPAKGQAVFSNDGANTLITLGDAGTRGFSTCIIQDQRGKELARVNFYNNGVVTFGFGSTSTVRGTGMLDKKGEFALGVMSDVEHRYKLSVSPDGSSVVHVIVRDDRGEDRLRTIRLSPRGDVLGDQP